jgi:hypothetical protein
LANPKMNPVANLVSFCLCNHFNSSYQRNGLTAPFGVLIPV